MDENLRKSMRGKIGSASVEELKEMVGEITPEEIKSAGESISEATKDFAKNGGGGATIDWIGRMVKDNRQMDAMVAVIGTIGRALGGVVMTGLPKDLHDAFTQDMAGLLRSSMMTGAQITYDEISRLAAAGELPAGTAKLAEEAGINIGTRN